MSDEEKGFKVVDRRGEETGDDGDIDEKDLNTGERTGMEEEIPLEIDFINFILSLSHSVMVHLGNAPHPECDGMCKVNLPMAKQGIDIISMLQEKTTGNLTGDEERILASLLTDLRLVYVSEAKKINEEKG